MPRFIDDREKPVECKCPRCTSRVLEVGQVRGTYRSLYMGRRAWERCHNCGWQGTPEQRENYKKGSSNRGK